MKIQALSNMIVRDGSVPQDFIPAKAEEKADSEQTADETMEVEGMFAFLHVCEFCLRLGVNEVPRLCYYVYRKKLMYFLNRPIVSSKDMCVFIIIGVSFLRCLMLLFFFY